MDNRLAQDIDTGPLQLKSIRWMLHAAHSISKPASGRLCYRVLARPPRGKRSISERTFLDTGQRSTMRVDRMRIKVYHWPGTGPTILLAHGWNSHSGRWEYLAPQLQQLGYNVYALDAPAHGESVGGHFAILYYARAMKALVEEIKPATIIGHSAGGMAATFYLHHDSEAWRPNQLAVLATPAELSHFMDSVQRILRLKKGVMDALEGEFIRRFNRPFAYFSTTHFIQGLELPGLIIHDQEDQVAPVHGAHTLNKVWSDSQLMLTNGLGHGVQDEAVRQRLLNWLQTEK